MKAKNSRRALTLFLIVGLVFTTLSPFVSIAHADGENWLTGYTYRKSHLITAGVNCGSNYQIEITTHYGSGSDSGNDVYLNSHTYSNFSDVAFTDNDGDTELYFDLRTLSDGSYADFVVVVADSLDSNATIYVYYGNTDDITDDSDKDNTYLIWFNHANLSAWDNDGDYTWTVSGSNPYYIVSPIAGINDYTHIRKSIDSCYGYRTEIEVQPQVGIYGNYYRMFQIGFGLQELTSSDDLGSNIDDLLSIDFYRSDTAYQSYWARKNVGGSQTDSDLYIENWGSGSYNSYDLRISSGSYATYRSGTPKNIGDFSNTTTITPYYFYLHVRRTQEYFRYLFITKWSEDSPTHSTWGTEENELTSMSVTFALNNSSVGVFVINNMTYANNTVLNLTIGENASLIGASYNENYTFSNFSVYALNNSWLYRQSHSILNASDAGFNYTIPLTINFSSGTSSGNTMYVDGKCQPDFDDIRFRASDGTTDLSYWLEDYTVSDYAKFWVKIPTNLSAANSLIYVYYNNSAAASLSDGFDTFPFFDDFNDSSLNSTLWYEYSSGGSYSEANGFLKLWSSSSSYEQIVSKIEVDYNYAFRMVANITEQIFTRVGTDSRYGGGNIDNMYFGYSSSARYDTHNNTAVTTTARATSLTSPTLLEIQYTENNATFLINDSNPVTHTTNVPDEDQGFWFLTFTSGSTVWVDYCLMRKFVQNEPQHGTWGNEEYNLILNSTITENPTLLLIESNYDFIICNFEEITPSGNDYFILFIAAVVVILVLAGLWVAYN